jgi:hypothetical protein
MKKTINLFVLTAAALLLLTGCGIAEMISPPTATPVPPTATPVPPTPTPEPAGPAGWGKFEGGGFSLWLPESFEGGNLADNLDVILEVIEGLGPDFQYVADIITQNQDIFVIYAFDTNLAADGSTTNVNVTMAEASPDITIDDYIAAVSGQLPAVMTITDSKTLTINGYDAAWFELHYELEGSQVAQLIYAIKDGGTFWAVTYSTTESLFGEKKPVFEESISTFEIE